MEGDSVPTSAPAEVEAGEFPECFLILYIKKRYITTGLSCLL